MKLEYKKRFLIYISVIVLLFISGVFAANAEENPTPGETTETQSASQEVKNGFYSEDGSVYLYIDNVMQVGLVNYEGKNYYFSQSGEMVKGFAKINNDTYYFDSEGVMQTGLVQISGKYYYFNSLGARQYGFKKIGNYNYYFMPNTGAAKTGFWTRKYKGKKINTYYAPDGKLKTGSFKVDTVKYKATKDLGIIYYCRNLAPKLCQRPKLPTGCEIVSWTMMANYAGVKISMVKAAKIMPRSKNPNKGFVGNPFKETGGDLVIYPKGLKSMTKKYLRGYTNMTKCSLKKIESKLYKKHLVLAWVGHLDGFESHTVALTGYDKKYFYYNDPWKGTARKMKRKTFVKKWKVISKRALSY